MMTRRGRATLMVVFAVIFAAFGLGLGNAFYRAGQPLPFVLGFAGCFLLVAVIAAVGLVFFLRNTRDVAGPWVRVEPGGVLPPAVPKRGEPWPFPALVAGLAQAFAGTPYVVLAAGDNVRIHAEIVDARWQHFATERHLRSTLVITMTPIRPGKARRTDSQHAVDLAAGLPRLGAQLAVKSGRSWGMSFRKEYAVGPQGLTKVVDYSFSTAELNRPIREVMRAAGWTANLDAESKTALVLACLGGSAIPLVPLALLIQHLMNR